MSLSLFRTQTNPEGREAWTGQRAPLRTPVCTFIYICIQKHEVLCWEAAAAVVVVVVVVGVVTSLGVFCRETGGASEQV